MAAPGSLSSTEISDIIATTIQNRSGVIADNVSNNNALLYRLKQRGNVKPFSGGDVILQELSYEDSNTNNSGWYSGYEQINVTPNSPFTASRWEIKQAAAAVSMSGLEILQNSGKEQIIDLIDARMELAESQLNNLIATGSYSDGTGNGGKQLTGLQAIVADAPTTGTVGGINRATWTFWRNIVYDASSDGGAAASATNIQAYMAAVALQLVRGTEGPDLIVADNNYYGFYLASMQAIQRVTDEKMAGAGFTSLKYYGAGRATDVVLDGGVGGACPANHMYFLNTKYLFFRPHRERNMVPIGGDRMAVNQDAIVRLIGFAGNMTASGCKFQGVLKA